MDALQEQTAPAPWEKHGDATTNQNAPATSLTDNRSGEGLYTMADPDGKIVSIPFSNVKLATAQNYSFPKLIEHLRYSKDAFAVSLEQGGTRPSFLPARPAAASQTGTIASFAHDPSSLQTTHPSPAKSSAQANKLGSNSTTADSDSNTGGLVSGAWDWMNRPINIGHLQQSLQDSADYANSPLPMRDIDDKGNFTRYYYLDQLHHFVAGFGADAGKTFTTPLSVGLTVAGALVANPELGAAAPKVVTLGRGALAATGIAFGAKGARDQIKQGVTKRADEDWYQYLARTSGNTGAVLGGALGLHEAAPILHEVPQAPARFAAGSRVDTVIPGDTVTPRQRYQAAKNQGVNLDLAQATDSKVTAAVKNATKDSFFGSPVYDRLQAANTQALKDHAYTVLDRATPVQMSEEELGNASQHALRQHRQRLNNEAEELLHGLSHDTEVIQPDPADIRTRAQQIVDANEAYYTRHPRDLRGNTAQAWDTVKSLAKERIPTVTVHTSPIFDASGYPFKSEISAPVGMTWSDMKNLHTKLMDNFRAPEITDTKAEEWLKPLIDTVAHSMDTGESKLTPEQLARLRQADELRTELQNTFDNPQSVIHQILQAPDGVTAARHLVNIKPAVARYLSTNTPEVVPHLQRQIIDHLFSPDKSLDLENLASRFTVAQKDALNGVLSKQQIEDVEDTARTARVMEYKNSPVIKARTGQAIKELGGMGLGFIKGGVDLAHRNYGKAALEGLAPPAKFLGDNAAARLMTNPEAVKTAMDQPKRGPSAWVNKGAGKLAAAGVAQADIKQLMQTFAGRQILMHAGSLGFGSRAMQAMIAQIATGAHKASGNALDRTQ